MKRIITLTLMALMVTAAMAKPVIVPSPDGKVILTVDNFNYTISYEGEVLVDNALAGLSVKGVTIPAKASSVKKKLGITEHINAPFYRQAAFDFTYNQVRLEFKGGFGLEWRVSNEGAAYRFTYNGKGETVILDETVDIRIPFDAKAWIPYTSNPSNPYAISFESSYTVQKLSDGSQTPGFLPSVFEAPSGVKLAVLESDTHSYPGMFIRLDGDGIKGEFARYPSEFRRGGKCQRFVTGTEDYIASTTGARTFPWRIFSIAPEDRNLPESNLVYALAEPSRIADPSWIVPGFSTWEWWNNWNIIGVDFPAGINMDTYRYYIDFAANYGLEYLIVDEGWYPSETSGDLFDVLNGLDIKELVDYGAERGVGIILWASFYSLDEHLDEYFKHYSEMGVAGFKVDFLDRNDQIAIDLAWRIAEAAAKYHLVLDYHGVFPPMGLNRTWPNVLNFESIKGLENARWASIEQFDMPEFDVTFPFIRQMAGFSDYTPGAMRNSQKSEFHPNWRACGSQGTRAHQVALYITTDSPLTMLCDSPSNYYANPETTQFISMLPRRFDETICLDGKIGEYIVMARRAGDIWYVAGLTNWEERDLEIPLSFAYDTAADGDALHYLEIFSDGVNAARNAEDYSHDTFDATPNDVVKVHLAPGGGFVLIYD